MTLTLLGMAALASVAGSLGPSSEPLAGYLDGDLVVLQDTQGTRCQGSLFKMTKDSGLATITCQDGRKGSVSWTMVGGQVVAGGWLNGQALDFVVTLN